MAKEDRCWVCLWNNCGYRAPRSVMVIHMRHHLGIKPFKCSHCDYRCSTKPNLKTHMINHCVLKKGLNKANIKRL